MPTLTLPAATGKLAPYTTRAPKNFPAALEIIAEALAIDKTGKFRERLMQKQSEVMQQVGMRHQQEYLLLINLVSKYAKKDESGNAKPPERVEPLEGS